MWTVLTLLACRPDLQVVWTSADADSSPSQFVSELFTPAAAEGDRALINVLHATGSELDMVVSARSGESVADWGVQSLQPLICQAVVAQTGPSDTVVPVTLAFQQEGTTDLFVIDAAGTIVDWQPVSIRNPGPPLVYAYEALATGSNEPLDQIDVLTGVTTTVAGTWQTEDGDTLAGAGLLDVSTADPSVAVEGTDDLANLGLESFNLTVAADATPGVYPLTLYAGEHEIRTVDVVVHGLPGVTDVSVSQQTSALVTDADGAVTLPGTLRATVQADGIGLVGTPVKWLEDGVEVGRGAWAETSATGVLDYHEVEACLGEICTTSLVLGTIVDTHAGSEQATGSGGCLCSAGGFASWPAALGAWLFTVSRRRKRKAAAAVG